MRNFLHYLWLYLRSLRAARTAASKGLPGTEFNLFGRRLGWRLLLAGQRGAIGHLLTPVSSTRYFEFPFALNCLPVHLGRCLDVSSPRLFSLYVAVKNPSAQIIMMNPDFGDLSDTAVAATRLGLTNIETQSAALDKIPGREALYDCIWSISVIEHVADTYDDRNVIKILYNLLKPGGRLILTIPVDREFWDEYRKVDYYGTQSVRTGELYFFQRFYDKNAIQDRLIVPIGREPDIVRWFGEKSRGRFMEYTQRWMRDGLQCTVDDPLEIAEHYQEFPSWEDMPGTGVAGLMFTKGNP